VKVFSDEIKKIINEIGESISFLVSENSSIMKKIEILKNKGYIVSITIEASEEFESDFFIEEEVNKNKHPFTVKDREFLKKLKIKLPDDSD